MTKIADAEQSKRTGGMLALYPTPESAELLLVDHPNAEPIEDLHLTLAYLGEDVSGYYSPAMADEIAYRPPEEFPPIQAKVMGHATFNPDGEEPCAVHLVGDNDYLPDLYIVGQTLLHANYDLPRQHTPWIPHVTGGYDMTAADLSYTGPIEFDMIAVTWGSEMYVHHFTPPLGLY